MKLFNKKHFMLISRLLCFICIFQFIFLNTNIPSALAATDATISYSVTGTPMVGNTIEILVNASDVQSLYGASIDFVYDTSLLEIQSIEKGSIYGTKSIVTPVNSFGKGQATFAIMLKGSQNGISGSGTIAIIKAKVLKEGSLKFKTTSGNTTLSLSDITCRVKLSNNNGGKITYTSPESNINLHTAKPLGVGTYEETDPNITFSGSWISENHSLYSSGAGKYSKTTGNTVEFTIDATAFELYVPAAKFRGRANIYIDGKLDSIMDQYAPSTQENTLVFSKYGLSPGKHTVKIETIADKHTNSSNPYIVFDKLVVSNSSLPTGVLKPGTYEESNPNIAIKGSWILEKHSLYNDGVGKYSKTTGNTVEFTIDATAFELYVPAAKFRGRANIYIDGKLDSIMDQYAPSTQENTLVFSKYGLSPGKHTIKIETIADKHTNSSNPYIVFDKLVVSNSSLPTGVLKPGTYEESNPNIALKGSWILEKHSLYSDGVGKYSKTVGNTVEFTIDATSFELYAPAAGFRGKANIYIDGKLDSVMDQYSSTLQENKLVFAKYGLSAGTHTIKIETIADTHPNSSNPYVVIDKIVVSNASVLPAGTYEENNPFISSKGSWKTENHSLYSKGSGKYSTTAGSTVEFTIYGSSLELYAPVATFRGKANIYIDGKLDSVMDQYSPTLQENKLVFAKYGLTSGLHTVKIETITDKHPNATTPYIVLDKIVVGNKSQPSGVLTLGAYEENNSNITFKGTWDSETHSLYSKGVGKYSKTSGNTVEFTFEGSAFELYAPSAKFRGKAKIYINGKLDSVMDQYSSTLQENKLVFSKYGLDYGRYTVKIETISDKHPNATTPYVVFDKLVIK